MEQNILEKILQGSMEPTNLPLELLRDITDGFSKNRIIAEGGFGIVYKILRRWRHRWNKSEKETSLKYEKQVTKCLEIGSLCQKVDPYARPSISEIMSKFVELESMDNCRMIAHDSAAGQIKPSHWEDDMLRVEPLELQFEQNSGNDKQLTLSCSVELSNDTDSFIAFNIQTTSPLPYSIEPNKDIVKPQTKCSLEITLPEANTQYHNNKKYTTEFIVQSIKVNEGLTTNDLNDEVFDTHISGQHVDEIYLSVISEEPCDQEVTISPSNQDRQFASSEGRPTPIKPGSVQLVIKNDSTVAPLLEHKKKVMLELTGGDYTSDRPGLDLVALVYICESLRGWKEGQLKTAMRFLVQKLSPMDRLSVITFSEDIKELWPLRQITEASQRELHDLISKIEPSGITYSRKGLQAGLNVLADREVRAGRVAAMWLVTSSGYLPYGYLSQVDLGNVPVYTFYFDNECSKPGFLAEIAAKSMGGTFSHVMEEDIGGLTMAFSQCLAGLLSVAVQNLELTVAAVGGESTIVKVSAGSYPQEQQQQNENGDSVTVRFGNLYSREVRKVIVELLLPTIHSEHSAEILDVTYSHDSSPGRMKFVATAETLTVCRTGVEFPEEERKPAWLLSEEARLQTVLMVKENKLVEAQKMPELQNFSKLRRQLEKIAGRFRKESSRFKFYPIALSWESCHDRQRMAWTGMRLFATPRMDKYMQQARKFLKEPTMSLPSVDDDVKEEMGALTVEVASREKEMRKLALDVVQLRPPPPQVYKSGGIFRMFREKISGDS